MLKKISSLTLPLLVLHLTLWLPLPVVAQSNNDPQLTERVKDKVAVIGVGARVSIKLREKKKLTGHISQIGENDFVVKKAEEGTKQTIAYTDVIQIKQKNEKRISTTGKILMILGALWVVGMISNGGG